MRVTDVIAAKRDGNELAAEDIRRIVLGYSQDLVPDYQMAAFLMAVFIRGMSFAETSAMTRAMIDSGETLDLSSVSGTKVDKHSTGGVGDKTTLVVVPMLAACGLKAPKMSGRGLGFTGGTLDKLESIPGFNTGLSAAQVVSQVRRIGAVMAGQTQDIVPADKKIYALRDVTATVDSIPLIAASIMSKKIACGSDVILLDVKVGSGAFMRDLDKARELANTMIVIGRDLGRRVGAVITDMSQPLGRAVGNALEVREAIDTLRGGGPEDLRRLCVELVGVMLYIAGQCGSVDDGRAVAESAVDSGAALSRFRDIVEAQGGDGRVVDDASILPAARYQLTAASTDSGWVAAIDTARVGMAACALGAGRECKEDGIDPAVGVVVEKKLGDRVERGESLAVIHANDSDLAARAVEQVIGSYTIGDKAAAPPLVRELVQ